MINVIINILTLPRTNTYSQPLFPVLFLTPLFLSCVRISFVLSSWFFFLFMGLFHICNVSRCFKFIIDSGRYFSLFAPISNTLRDFKFPIDSGRNSILL